MANSKSLLAKCGADLLEPQADESGVSCFYLLTCQVTRHNAWMRSLSGNTNNGGRGERQAVGPAKKKRASRFKGQRRLFVPFDPEQYKRLAGYFAKVEAPSMTAVARQAGVSLVRSQDFAAGRGALTEEEERLFIETCNAYLAGERLNNGKESSNELQRR